MCARAFVEGRLSEEQLSNSDASCSPAAAFRPTHPWLMPDFWQFPNVSMGLGPKCNLPGASIATWKTAALSRKTTPGMGLSRR